MIEVLAFDGDDTLWHSESLFAVTQERVAELLAPYVGSADLHHRLLHTERSNLELYGYGVKGFTLSLIETAIAVSEQQISAADLQTILGWCQEMLRHPVELIDGVAETLATVSGQHRLVLVTKGDLFHQETKLAASGLAEHFEHVAIVSEKDPATYLRVAAQVGVHPAAMLMVGNSVRSDVTPVLEIGGWAVHVPYHVTWDHERAELPPNGPEARHRELDDIRQLPALLAQLRAG